MIKKKIELVSRPDKQKMFAVLKPLPGEGENGLAAGLDPGIDDLLLSPAILVDPFPYFLVE